MGMLSVNRSGRGGEGGGVIGTLCISAHVIKMGMAGHALPDSQSTLGCAVKTCFSWPSKVYRCMVSRTPSHRILICVHALAFSRGTARKQERFRQA